MTKVITLMLALFSCASPIPVTLDLKNCWVAVITSPESEKDRPDARFEFCIDHGTDLSFWGEHVEMSMQLNGEGPVWYTKDAAVTGFSNGGFGMLHFRPGYIHELSDDFVWPDMIMDITKHPDGSVSGEVVGNTYEYSTAILTLR